jgi:uncharacterized protein (TIGR02271 family)
MANSEGIDVSGLDGPLGVVLNEPGDAHGYATLLLSDGRMVSVPLSAFVSEADGSYSLPLRRADFDNLVEAVIPVIAEELIISKRQVPTGGMRVSKTIQQHDEIVSMPVSRERVDIRRVIINRDVDGPVPIRHDGNTIIVPVVEEVLIVEKQLRLKEELHITRRTIEEQIEQPVTLQREQVTIERVDAEGQTVVEEPVSELPPG